MFSYEIIRKGDMQDLRGVWGVLISLAAFAAGCYFTRWLRTIWQYRSASGSLFQTLKYLDRLTITICYAYQRKSASGKERCHDKC